VLPKTYVYRLSPSITKLGEEKSQVDHVKMEMKPERLQRPVLLEEEENGNMDLKILL
jgi:hypothetical protein